MNSKKAIFLPPITGLTFAGSFVAGKYAIFDMPPLTITLLRYIIALISLGLLLPYYKLQALKVNNRDLPKLALLGLLGVIGYHFFFFSSLNYTAVANTAIINATSPVITGFLASIFIRERLSGINYTGILIALVGVLILLTGGKIENLTGLNFNFGDILMLCAVVSWAIYALIVKTLMIKYSGYNVTFYGALFGVLILAVITPIFEGVNPHIGEIGPTAVYSILYMGIIASGVGYFLYNQSVHEIGPTRTSSYVYSTVPVFVAVLAFLFFAEPITLLILLSILLIITGLHLVLRK